MNFIYPSFLWALTFIAVPVLIHILNLRKHKTIYFSNVNLLKIVQKQTQRKSKLKQLLILASRILFITTLVLAFAKPFIPSGNAEKQMTNNIVGIYIDNSFSMNAEGPEGKAIESAKQKAFAIVNGSRPDTRFALLTNSLDENQSRFYTKNEMISLITDITVIHNTTALSTILLRYNSMLQHFLVQSNKSLYIISDFQKTTSDFSEIKADTLLNYNFVPVPVNNLSNLYIDSCWFEAPTHHFNQIEQLNVRIINRSNESYRQIPVKFYLNDSLKALASIDFTPGEQKIVPLEYTNVNKGLQLGKIDISDYPIVYDNTIYLAYTVKNSLKALIIQESENRTSKNIKALFNNDDYIQLSIDRADRLQISSLSNFSTIFLNEIKSISSGLTEELTRFVKNGGSLVIIPNPICNVESYNTLLLSLKSPALESIDTLAIPIGEVDYQHPLYEDVFKDENQKVALPEIKIRYRFSNNPLSAETNILSFADKSKALSLSSYENGKLFMFAFPLSNSANKFIDHLLFLPTFYNIVLQSSYNQQLYYVIGKDHVFELKLTDRSQSIDFMLKQKQTGNELIPSILQQKGNLLKLSVDGDFDAGFYEIYADKIMINGLAFNYHLQESDLDYYSGNEILKLAQKAGLKHTNLVEANSTNLIEAIKEIDNGKQLWKIFLIIALCFVAIEAAIIRFWP